jgi:hypothetical protein
MDSLILDVFWCDWAVALKDRLANFKPGLFVTLTDGHLIEGNEG